MYAGVPITSPALVSASGSTDSWMARAIPKSATTACPPVSRMFSGLMSRWMTPCACAYPSAAATSRAMPSASSTGSCFSRARRARSDSPSTYGMV